MFKKKEDIKMDEQIKIKILKYFDHPQKLVMTYQGWVAKTFFEKQRRENFKNL